MAFWLDATNALLLDWFLANYALLQMYVLTFFVATNAHIDTVADMFFLIDL